MSTFNTKSKLMEREEPSLSDVLHAIQAHKQCASHLEEFMCDQSQDKLDPDMIGDHESCALGHWLNTTCKNAYGNLPLVDEVIATHKSLHFTARHILFRYYDGEVIEALGYLHDGAFPNNSARLKNQLSDMAYLIKQHHPGLASTVALSAIMSECKG